MSHKEFHLTSIYTPKSSKQNNSRVSGFEFAFPLPFTIPLHEWKSIFRTITISHWITIIRWTHLVGDTSPESFRDGKVRTFDAGDVTFQSSANGNVTNCGTIKDMQLVSFKKEFIGQSSSKEQRLAV